MSESRYAVKPPKWVESGLGIDDEHCFAGTMDELPDDRGCMDCGTCHDCIVRTIESAHAAEIAEGRKELGRLQTIEKAARRVLSEVSHRRGGPEKKAGVSVVYIYETLFKAFTGKRPEREVA